MIDSAGMTVLRQIPLDFLVPGNSVYGGVVRDTAGRIVSHLAMPAAQVAIAAPGGPVAVASAAVAAVSGLVSNAQLVSLSKDVHQVLQVAMAGTTLAGLGLATSIVGFVYLKKRMDRVDRRLDELKIAIKKVQQILDSMQQSNLLSAIETYKLSGETNDTAKREALLMQARDGFSKLTHHYKLQLKNVRELAEVEVAEGYFTVACLGNAVCTSDLDLFGPSATAFRGHYIDWQVLTRQHCKRLVDLENSTRLLDGDYVDSLPTAALIDVLDFSNGKERGVNWLDDLRRPLGTARLPSFGGIDKEAIEFAKKMAARDHVLDSFAAHFDFLAANKVQATAFARVLEDKANGKPLLIEWKNRSASA